MKTYKFRIDTEDYRKGTILEIKVNSPLSREDALQKAMRIVQLPRTSLIYIK